MINLQLAELFFGLITTIVAYFIVVSISGYFRALVALKMGDHTPTYMGFLTMNPIKHSDFMGFVCLIIFGFGWGRYIPILSFNISGKLKNIKIFLANFSDIIANIITAIIALIGLVIYFGSDVLRMALPIRILLILKRIDYAGVFGLANGIVAIKSDLSILFPNTSSFAISMVMIAIATIYLSTLMAALNFIINGFWYVYTTFINQSNSKTYNNNLLLLLVPMLLIYFLIEPLRVETVKFIANFVTFLAKLFGLY